MSRNAPETECRSGPEPRSTLLAVVVGQGENTTCTIHPPGIAVPERGSRWISARGESFVDLAACR